MVIFKSFNSQIIGIDLISLIGKFSKLNNEIDARGMRCPMPLLKLKQALNKMSIDDSVTLLATDATSKKDVLEFCKIANHKASFVESKSYIAFTVVKGA